MRTSLRQCLLVSLALMGQVLCYSQALAFNYEVLFEETSARDAALHGREGLLSGSLQSVFLDGQVRTDGTDATTNNRLWINSLRILKQLPLTGPFSLRTSLPLAVIQEKTQSEQGPGSTAEASWIESRPRVELTYTTSNNLDLIIGLNLHAISGYEVKTTTANFAATDTYESLLDTYAHVALVKKTGQFQGGFAWQMSSEATRSLTKRVSLEANEQRFEDRVYQPTTMTIFAYTKRSFADLYAEFAAVEASGGGNRNENGRTVREDYFRVQFAAMIPLPSPSLRLETALLYKSLSYADNRAITQDTIPMAALHLKLHITSDQPYVVGLLGVRGSDGQSLQEFNAAYRVLGWGATVGMTL